MEMLSADELLAVLEVLQKVFGLTPSESEISLELLAGKNLREISGLRGVSIHTVRNQVKSAMTKAGAKRQAEYLLRLDREIRG